MKLQDIINHNVISYQDFERALSNSDVNLSFFGSPVLVSQISDDSVSISDAVRKWFSLGRKDVIYSAQECRAAISSKNMLLRHYSTSDELADRSYNIFVVFSRIVSRIINIVDPAVRSLTGVPLTYLCEPSDRRDLVYCPEKIGIPVLDQAEKTFGLIS